MITVDLCIRNERGARPCLLAFKRSVVSPGETLKKIRGNYPELILECLRVYEDVHSVASSLAEVYSWAREKNAVAFPHVRHTCLSLADAMARGKVPLARAKAIDLYADCFLALGVHVVAWNLEQKGMS